MDKTDEKLVQEYLSGNEHSLELLLDKYLKPLYNFVFRLLGNQAVSEDIVQETFLKAWNNLERFDASQKFSTWLFAIAKNTAFDWLRKKKEFNFSLFENEQRNFLESIEDESALYAENLFAKMDKENDAFKLLNNMSPELKSIISLHHYHGFTLKEIAEIMGKPTNTLKSKYHRAIIELRRKFSDKNAYLKQKTIL